MDCLLDSGNLLGDCVSTRFYRDNPTLFTDAAPAEGSRKINTIGVQADGKTPVKIEKEAFFNLRLSCKGETKSITKVRVYVTDIARDCILGLGTLITHCYKFYLHVLSHWHKAAMVEMLEKTPREFCALAAVHMREYPMQEVNAQMTSRHNSGCGNIEVYDTMKIGWGARVKENPSTKRTLQAGKLRLPYGRAVGEDSLEALGKTLDGYIMEVQGKWFTAKQDSLEYAVMVNDSMDDEAHNMKPIVDDSGRLILENTRDLEPNEVLSMPYGPGYWIDYLDKNKGSLSQDAWHELFNKVQAYYKPTDQTTINAFSINSLNNYEDLVRAFTSIPDVAPEEEEISETLIYPAELSSIDLKVPHPERVQTFLDTYREKVHDGFLQHQGVVKMFEQLGAEVFVPKQWNGITHEDGTPWIFNIKWREPPPDVKRKNAYINARLFEAVSEEFRRLELAGFFEKSESSVASKLVVAPKATTPFVRLCGDYSPINKFMLNEQFEIPLVEQEIQQIACNRLYANIDLTNAFHQLRIDEVSSERLSISTPFGQFKPKFLPEGIKVASQLLQRAVKTIFASMKKVIILFDNFLILADSHAEMKSQLEEFFTICKKHNLTLKLSKSEFAVRETSFFGYKVGGGKFCVEQDRLDAIDDLVFPPDADRCKKPAQKIQAMQSYLGIGQFIAPFIAGYHEMTYLLSNMTHQDFNWDESTWLHDYRLVFEQHKARIKEVYSKYFPDYSLEWVMRVDASSLGSGGVLFQRRPLPDGTERLEPLQLFCHKFSQAAVNWQVSDQEAYAIWHGVNKCKNLVRGKEFILETDHRNLLWAEKSTIPKIMRMVSYLSSYNIWVRHISGKDNIVADGLSRLMRGIKMTAEEDRDINALIEELSISGLDEVHGGVSGHLGVKRTWDLLNKDYPGHGYSVAQVEDYIKECAVCQKYRTSFQASLQPLLKTLHRDHPRSSIAIDTLQMAPDDNGNKYLLVIVNMFTKLVTAYPVPDKRAITTANKLMTYFSMYGLVDTMHSDRGSDFESTVIAHLLEWLGVKRTHTLAFSPWSAGVEPSVKEVSRHVQAICADNDCPERWSDERVIALATLIINEHPHTSTNITPYIATFGSDAATYFALDANESEEKVAEYVQQLDKDLRLLRDRSKNFQDKQATKKTAGNSLVAQNLFQPGDLVLNKGGRNRRSSKLESKKLGPYRVIDHLPDHNYVSVENMASGKHEQMNCCDLEIFIADEYTSTRMAAKDKRESVVDAVIGYQGDPRYRSETQWHVKWSDSDDITIHIMKDIEQTVAFEKFCLTQRILSQLLLTKTDGTKFAKQVTTAVPEVQPGDYAYVDLRSFGYGWYDGLISLPDRFTTVYKVLGVYQQWKKTKHEKTTITIKFPAYRNPDNDKVYQTDVGRFWMYFHGHQKALGPGEMLLDHTLLQSYGALNALEWNRINY